MSDAADWALDHYGMPDPDGERYPCETCGGTGKIGRRKCDACKGSGEGGGEHLREGERETGGSE